MTQTSNISDSSQPNAGRIYDYLLGGQHNFEVDRNAAEMLLSAAPFMPQVLKLIRWFLGEATRRLAAEGFDRYIDFASGLPTVGHIHHAVPEGAKIIYSDIDQVTVEYGREILKDNQHVRYEECDAAKPEMLLNSEIITELLGEERKVAVGYNGIAYFLSNEEVAHALSTVYDWAGEGTKLFLCDADADEANITDDMKAITEIYKQIGQPLYMRPKERLIEMAKPWKIAEPGIKLLDDWLDMGDSITKKEMEEWGGAGFYGVILEK